MNKISKKYVENYITSTYGYIKPSHNINNMVKAIRQTSKKYDVNKVDLFHLIIENKSNIPFAISYGFQTSYGRELINDFKYNYSIL